MQGKPEAVKGKRRSPLWLKVQGVLAPLSG